MVLEEENIALRGEVAKLKKDHNDKLLLDVQLMKEALKEVEPTFALERLEAASLAALYPKSIGCYLYRSPSSS